MHALWYMPLQLAHRFMAAMSEGSRSDTPHAQHSDTSAMRRVGSMSMSSRDARRSLTASFFCRSCCSSASRAAASSCTVITVHERHQKTNGVSEL
jgi:hypothetical protein